MIKFQDENKNSVNWSCSITWHWPLITLATVICFLLLFKDKVFSCVIYQTHFSRQHFQTKKRVENRMSSRVFLINFEVFGNFYVVW